MSRKITRRQFNAGMTTASFAAVASSALTASSARAASGANERIRIGIIGLGNRGNQLIDSFLPHKDAEFVALCDVYSPHIDFAVDKIKKVDSQPFTTKDYRQLLDRKDIDAVVIATPDHWHARQFIDACEAGKDVYVEKPTSLVVRESRAMVEAARKAKCVAQVGIHRRSVPVCRQAAELIQSGAIGKVTMCRCFHLTNEWPFGIGNAADSPPPEGLDWDMWLGPAPKVPYNEDRCFYKFRWFRHYSGGQMTNFGTHWLDMIQWAIGQNAPRGVFAVGSRIIKDLREIPDTLEAVWDYPDGTLVSLLQSNTNASRGTHLGASIEFRGTNGTLYIGGDKVTVVPEAVRTAPLAAMTPTDRDAYQRQAAATRPSGAEALTISGSTSETVSHARNFLDCVKSRSECHCSIEAGHRSTVTTLIANIACDRKKYLEWDAEKERFINDDEANKALSCEYREPWKRPF